MIPGSQIRARMQRGRHGCSAEGTWAGRTVEPASLGQRKQKKSNRFAICFVCIVVFKLGTAFSNVRRDGVI